MGVYVEAVMSTLQEIKKHQFPDIIRAAELTVQKIQRAGAANVPLQPTKAMQLEFKHKVSY